MDGRFVPADEGLELPDAPPVQDFDLDDIWWKIVQFLGGIDRWGDREVARRTLIRRLAHPELGGKIPGDVHPKSGGWTAAGSVSPPCARCGSPRNHHDIDGQHDSCDGYVEAK